MPLFARSRLLRCLITAALAGCRAGPAFGATDETQGWTTAQVQVDASRTDIVTMDVSQRFRERRSGDEQQLIRVILDHLIAPGVRLGGGIAYLEGAGEKEHRLFQQLSVQRGQWVARTRLEQRFYDNGDDPLVRLRQRLQFSQPIDSAQRWTLVMAGEAMWHLNRARAADKKGFATWRAQIGLRRAIGRNIDLQLLYMRQHSIRDNRSDAIAHVPWLTLSWRI